jgi:large subunit ribosomal protein L22
MIENLAAADDSLNNLNEEKNLSFTGELSKNRINPRLKKSQKISLSIRKILLDKDKTTMVSKSIRISPTKFYKLLSKIRGKNILQAEKILEVNCLNLRSVILKAIYAAQSNLKAKAKLEGQLNKRDLFILKRNLVIDEAFVNQGSILKRMQPRARGKGYRIEKKFSHLTIKLKAIKNVKVDL